MNVNEIRQRFIKYFEKNGHKMLPSSSLVPVNDPTLLFINAGMVPFKDEFMGKSNPIDKRIVTIQKCVRAGGKHNDLENVGFTARHHTFFEMMGNFSFGDYFKKEAIQMAWNFLTCELKLPKEKLYVTVHHSDQEAADIWHLQEGVPKDHLFFRSDKDNFWEMGEVGPCGPCSEIFFDHGKENSDSTIDISECILDDEDRYIEIWNLVFMQFERYKENGQIKQRELPRPSVDTGSGLERVTAAMQNVYNNFDSNLFKDIIANIEKISSKKYTEFPQWMRVIADHARSATMLLADGVIPANEGRGYVLRRIIRRAIRHLDLLGVKDTSFYQLTPYVFDSLGELYDENKKNTEFIQKYLRLEEDGFRKTLASGLKLLEKKMNDLKKNSIKTLSGIDAFMLYDTHGFPIDLTEMILKENNLAIDLLSFDKEMNIQKERSKNAGDFSAQADNSQDYYAIKESKGESLFNGYEQSECEATLVGKVESNEKIFLIFNQTPFYAEGGGQAGDVGVIFEGDRQVAVIEDTKKPVNGIFAHLVGQCDNLEIGKKYILKVNQLSRGNTTCNHTATHLLQAALIKVLGNHIKQAGSNVGPSRLRFDFTHPEPLSKSQLVEVERMVNTQINKKIDVNAKIMSKSEAVKLGAMALFGEKYGLEVRVINISDFSLELCGGTHVKNTGDIGFFKILSESSLAAGVRRIEAVSNIAAYDFVDKKLNILEQLENILNSKGESLISKANQMQDNLQKYSKELQGLKNKIQAMNTQGLFDEVTQLKDEMVFKHINLDLNDDMRKVGDLFIDKHPKGVVLITQTKGNNLGVLLKTFKKNKQIDCSSILKETLKNYDGKGGGKADVAQGSINPVNRDDFINEMISKILK